MFVCIFYHLELKILSSVAPPVKLKRHYALLVLDLVLYLV